MDKVSRNSKGQFLKGSKPMNGFKKGVVPATAFKKGAIPWNKRTEIFSNSCKTCGKLYFKPKEVSLPRFKKRVFCSYVCKANDPVIKENYKKLVSVPFTEERKQKHKLAFKRGEESHRWIEDRSKIKGRHERTYHDAEYKFWRKEVWKRDNYKCKIDNKDCEGRLETHHILSWRNYPELRYQINNGICLCHAHHPIKRAEEKRLESYFMELVSVSR